MLKRLILMISLGMLVSSLAMTAHSADVGKIKPGDLRQAPTVVQTPEKIDTGNIQRPKPDLTITVMQLYPANPTVNDQIRVTATLNNIGDIPAGSLSAAIRHYRTIGYVCPGFAQPPALQDIRQGGVYG